MYKTCLSRSASLVVSSLFQFIPGQGRGASFIRQDNVKGFIGKMQIKVKIYFTFIQNVFKIILVYVKYYAVLRFMNLTQQKSALTKEINLLQKEIDWICQDEVKGKPVPKYYMGELRLPQLLILKRDLSVLKFKRKKLDI